MSYLQEWIAPVSTYMASRTHSDTHALRRFVRLMRRPIRGELGQEAAGGSITRETR